MLLLVGHLVMQSLQEAATPIGNIYQVTQKVYFNEPSIPYQITAMDEIVFIGTSDSICALSKEKILFVFGKHFDMPAGVWIQSNDLLVADSLGAYTFRNIKRQIQLGSFTHERLIALEKVNFPRTIKSSGEDILVTHELNNNRVIVSFKENKFGYCILSQATTFSFGRNQEHVYSISNNGTSLDSYLSYFGKECSNTTEIEKSYLGSLGIVGMSYTDRMYRNGGTKMTKANIITASQKLGKIVIVNSLLKTHHEFIADTNSSTSLIPWDVWTDSSGFWFSEHRYRAIYYVSVPRNYIVPLVVVVISVFIAAVLFCIIMCCWNGIFHAQFLDKISCEGW